MPLASFLAAGTACCSMSCFSGVSIGAGAIFSLPHTCRVVLVAWWMLLRWYDFKAREQKFVRAEPRER